MATRSGRLGSSLAGVAAGQDGPVPGIRLWHHCPLTGSFALAFYATPRMTRDLDIVDADLIRSALSAESLFNLMHYGTGIKVDLIIRKSSPYRLLEFSRRRSQTPS